MNMCIKGLNKTYKLYYFKENMKISRYIMIIVSNSIEVFCDRVMNKVQTEQSRDGHHGVSGKTSGTKRNSNFPNKALKCCPHRTTAGTQ